MTNTVKCQDCPTTMTRGNAHVRSVAFEQVFFCGPCMVQTCADLPEPMPLTRRLVAADVL